MSRTLKSVASGCGFIFVNFVVLVSFWGLCFMLFCCLFFVQLLAGFSSSNFEDSVLQSREGWRKASWRELVSLGERRRAWKDDVFFAAKM